MARKFKGIQKFDLIENDGNAWGIVQKVKLATSGYKQDDVVNVDWYDNDGVFIINKNVFVSAITVVGRLKQKINIAAAIDFVIYDAQRELVECG